MDRIEIVPNTKARAKGIAVVDHHAHLVWISKMTHILVMSAIWDATKQ